MNNADMPAMPQSNAEIVQAFMDVEQAAPNGLTKREHFAGLAMQGLLNATNPDGVWNHEPHTAAIASIEYADALLAELERTA